MKKQYLFTICCIAMMAVSLSSMAQVFIMRNYFPAPLEDRSYSSGFFGKLAFSAEGARGYGSALDEQAWNMKYIGFVELYRFSSRSAIGGYLAHEFTANPHNEINFHMRGAIWNETVSWFYKLPVLTFELGVTHHCRHEIDNTVPANELTQDDDDYQPTRRLIILTSPFLSLQSNWWKKGRFAGRLYSRFNLYTYRVDGRRPRGNNEQDLEYLMASALAGGRIDFKLTDQIYLFGRGWANPAYFTESTKTFKYNYRIEKGISFPGRVASFEVFCGYEHFFDDMSRPFPLPSSVFSFGIRGRGKDLF